MSEPVLLDIEPLDAQPVRFWWLKRLALVWIALFVALIGLRLEWGREAASARQRLVDEAHARGEPVYYADFETPGIGDDQNAAIDLRAAAAAVTWTQAQQDWDDSQFYPFYPLSQDDLQIVRTLRASNADALRSAHNATEKPEVDWGPGQRSTIDPDFGPQTHLVETIAWVGFLEHEEGHEVAYFDRLREIAFAASAHDRGAPSVMRHSVAGGMNSIRRKCLLNTAAELRIAPESGGLAPADVQRTIHELLDTSQSAAAYRQAWLGERARALDVEGTSRAFAWTSNSLMWIIMPALETEGVRSARFCEMAARRIDSSGKMQLGVLNTPASTGTNRNTWLASRVGMLTGLFLVPQRSVQRMIENQLDAVAESRICAVMLAMRCYVVDHKGALPQTLDDLVPKYLAKVPLDPFATDGSALRYRRDTRRPVLYSVGSDGIDDGGSEVNRGRSGSVWDKADAVFPYFRDPPTPPLTGPQFPELPDPPATAPAKPSNE